MQELITTILVLIGAFFVLVGSFGLLRLPDFYTRLHGPSKATTLGLVALLTAAIVDSIGSEAGLSLGELLITFFLFITAPISALVLARAALRRRVRTIAEPPKES